MNHISRCKPLLGTYVEVSLAGDMPEKTLLAISSDVFKAIENVEISMSFHNPNSELSHLNQQAWQQPCHISPPMAAVLRQALALSALSNGLFDISIAPALIEQSLLPDTGLTAKPSANWQHIQLDVDSDTSTVYFSEKLLIDLGGIAKGYAVDEAFRVLEPHNVIATINAGGDLRMSHWQQKTLSIRHPARPSLLIDVPMANTALATSAGYYLHNTSAIISPLNGKAHRMNNSISVFADSCMLADALTKIAVLNLDNNPLFSQLGARVAEIDRSGQLNFL